MTPPVSIHGEPSLDVRVHTLVDLLRWRAFQHPDRLAYTFLADGEADEVRLTYGALDRKARAIGALLQDLCPAGERALLLYPPGLEYIAAFFGCLYAGVIAVPAYPPRPNRADARLQAVARDARASIALTTTSAALAVEHSLALLPDLAGLRCSRTDELPDALGDRWREPGIAGDAIAFLQYTSGSTGNPKGVMVTHGNILHNEAMVRAAMGHAEGVIFVTWLPPYHDMGLIGSLLQPLYVGGHSAVMAPAAFLQRPFRWLAAISRYRAHTSGAPNFAYDLCVRKVTPEQRATLDLSCWRVAYSGAEPVRVETLEHFAEVFAPCGFRREALYPCYGLAEATLFVSGGAKSAPPVVGAVDAAALEQHRVAGAPAGADGARELVGCGRAWSDQTVAIVDPESLTRCAPGRVGEIWVAGPSVAQGYWNRPEETAETVKNTFRLVQDTQPTFFATQMWFYDHTTPIHQRAGEFKLQGGGYGWRHSSMAWQEAADWVEEMLRETTASIYIPQTSFTFETVFYLLGRGYPLSLIKDFLCLARGLLIDGFGDRHTDTAPYKKKLADLFAAAAHQAAPGDIAATACPRAARPAGAPQPYAPPRKREQGRQSSYAG